MRGWVTVTAATDEPERRFAVGCEVLLDTGARTVRDVRQGPRLAVLLSGVDDRDAAEALRGQWMYVDADADPPADPDEFYDHQLEGLAVLIDGVAVGRVAEVLHLPGQDVLAVDLEARGQVLVPFVAQFVPVVDLASGHLCVTPVEGLLDAD